MRNTHKGATSTKTADIQYVLFWNWAACGNSPVILQVNDYFKENPWMDASKYTTKLQNLCIFTDKNILIKFKIIITIIITIII